MTTAKHKLKFSSGRRAKKTESINAAPTTRIPRITKMIALAIRFDHLIKTGQVKDQAELARLGNVSRARLTQITNLLLLAPDIQEDLVLKPIIRLKCNLILESQVRGILITQCWHKQRKLWKDLLKSASDPTWQS